MNRFANLRRQKFLSFTVVLLTLSVGVLIGTLLNTGVKAAHDAVAPGATPLAVPSPSVIQNSFAGIAKQLEPSVVNISSEYIPKEVTQSRNNNRRRVVPDQEQDQDQGGMEDFFRRFFGNQMPFPQQEQRGASLGSGFVVDRNGYILTNNHVVEKANRIRVKFNNDPSEYDAKVIGTDWQTDLAVIKIERTNLTPVRIGNSDAIQVGDWAIAIGSPFGFQESVTAGIISAKSRDIPGDSTNFQHFLQTDAAINPGNSGGPLLNINGEVIGINTQIASRSGGYQGIGFAMPMNTAVNVYNQIIKTGKVTRGSIGIQFSANTDHSRDLLKVYGAKNGIFVAHVESGGPADKAGLREQDIITSVNGQKIVTGNDLIDIVASTPIGQSVTVDYIRDGKPMQTHVTIADRAKIFPKEGGLAENGDNDNGSGDQGTQASFGISIQNLNDRMKESMGLKDNGVVVQSVEPGSFAEDMGLIQGDVITAINRRPVTSVDQFKQLQGQLHPGDAVALRVLRNTAQGRGGNAQWQTIYPAGTVPANGQ